MSTDNVKPLRQQEAVEVDPFEQAQVADHPESIRADREEVAHGQLDPNEALDPEDAPEPVRRVKQQTAKAGAGKGLSYTAIGLSLVAIAMSGVSIMGQQGLSQSVTSQLSSLEGYVTEAREQAENVLQRVAENTKAIAGNTQKIVSFADLQSELAIYGSVLDQMKADTSAMRTVLNNNHASIQTHNAALDDIRSRVTKLESTPKPIAKAVQKARPAPKPKVDTSSLDGAVLGSIDAWGAQMNVMLRDPEGKWVAVGQGDYYNGWRLLTASGTTATFKKGSETRKLTVEG